MDTNARGKTSHRPAGDSPAFLLAQVGAHAAMQFGKRLEQLTLTRPHAGILRILQGQPGMTQQALADVLGMVPSRLVALIDELEDRGLVERRDNAEDRRRHALHLTEAGRASLEAIGRVALEHEQALLAVLSADEQRQLAALLQRVADQQGLTRQVHPGYARMRRGPAPRENS
jgi:DNA-binding MarR family transcriptional regulator